MKRISYCVSEKETIEIFAELREMFREEDYTAATTGFEYRNGYDNSDGYKYGGKPRTVIIIAHNEAIATYFRIKYFGIMQVDITDC